jgi:hypothetical protein
MRFIELHLADLLAKYPRLRRTSAPPPSAEQKSALKVLPPAAYEAEVQHAYQLLESLGAILPHVRVQVRLHASHLFAAEDDLNLTDNKSMTPGRFDASCNELLASTYLRYSVSRVALLRQHDVFWHASHLVCAFVTECLDEHASFLQDEHILALFNNCQVRISRAVAAWQYICSLAPPV